MTMVVLYPVVASMIVVIAQYAYSRSQIAKHRGDEEEEKIWKNFRNFCYLFAVMLMLAAFAGVFFYDAVMGAMTPSSPGPNQ